MRSLQLFILLLLIFGMTACGSEELMTPPVFDAISVNGLTDLSRPSQDSPVIISGTIDDFNTKIVATRTSTGEAPVSVVPVSNSPTGSWTYSFTPEEGVNFVTFTASDRRGNINQLYLTVTHDITAPGVISVTQGNNPQTLAPQLVVAFNEALLATSLTTATFAVVTDNISSPLIADPLNPLTPGIVTLPLSVSLAAGPHHFTCSGVTDLSTPSGNSAVIDYPFEIPIQ